MSLPLPCYLNMSELTEAVKQLGVITQTLLVQEVPQVSHNQSVHLLDLQYLLPGTVPYWSTIK